jgi:murein L,D-transpeptidase YafK
LRNLVWILLLLLGTGAHAAQVETDPVLVKADSVLVRKSEKALYLLKDGKPLKRYHVVFGPRAKGPKLMEGDERTPEGNYTLDFKNTKSRFYKSIRVSYPNEEDIAKARKYNVDPGGNIMIHGTKNSWNAKTAARARNHNWTDGCIALSNSDMDEVWEAVDIGTPISILP